MTDLWPIAVKICLSAVLAGAVGAEREWTGKWAGLRTHMLIAVGSTLLTDLSIRIGPLFAEGSTAWDPGRIAAQIVTGVGFIGAGTIIQARGTVHGLTTAAGLWVASAIGMAVGADFYKEATVCTVALLIILAALPPLERRLFRGERRSVLLTLGPEHDLSQLMVVFQEAGIEPEELTFSRTGRDDPQDVLVRFRGSQAREEKLLDLAVQRNLLRRDRL